VTDTVDAGLIEELLLDLSRIPQMLFVLGGEGAVAEMFADGNEVTVTDGYANVKAESWHVHIKLADVSATQFVEAEDHGTPKLYYVRFSDIAEETLFRIYFPNPYMDERGDPISFQPARLAAFEEKRDKYVGRGGIVMAYIQQDP
jgi:putative heme iron utilization protein